MNSVVTDRCSMDSAAVPRTRLSTGSTLKAQVLALDASSGGSIGRHRSDPVRWDRSRHQKSESYCRSRGAVKSSESENYSL